VAALQEELKINPTFTPALYYLGEIALEQNDPQRAADFFRRAISHNPSCVDAYIGLGKAEMRAGRPKDAVVAFEQANRLDDRQPDIHYLLATAYRELHEPEKRAQELHTFEALRAEATSKPAGAETRQERWVGTTCLTRAASKLK
jgi:cytochrome c-type biogenesis protein CcmH/NrfG